MGLEGTELLMNLERLSLGYGTASSQPSSLQAAVDFTEQLGDLCDSDPASIVMHQVKLIGKIKIILNYWG